MLEKLVRFPRDIWVIIGLTFLLWGAQYSRQWVFHFKCGESPSKCVPASVTWPDRLTLGVKGGDSDLYSNYTQYAAGALAVLAPMALGGVAAAFEVVPLAISALTNGVVNEGVRLLVQRPRPYVYADPKTLGKEDTSYTSFYSGHTSFATVAAVHLVLALRRRKVKRSVLWGFGAVGVTLVFLTALFRVLSGYHFISDVLVGVLAGSLISYAISGRRGP